MSASVRYTSLPSAFRIGQIPALMSLDLILDGFQSCTHSIPRRVASITSGYLIGFVAMPIHLASIPVSIVADVVIGVAEAIFIAKKGAPRKDIQELLFKKLVASPIQQLTYGAVTGTLFYAIPLIWPLTCCTGVATILLLPNSINHKRIHIFYKTERTNGINIQIRSKLKDRVKETRDFIRSNVDASNPPANYTKFKNTVLNKESAWDLFEYTNDQLFTRSELDKKYKKLSLIIHPDKNSTRAEEARLLFTCLNQAYKDLQPLATDAATG